MFKSLKLYTGCQIELEKILGGLVELGYKRQDAIADEGDFSRRGEIIDIFPSTFELPIRISLDLETVASIKTFVPRTGELLWEHQMVIILPARSSHSFRTAVFSEYKIVVDGLNGFGLLLIMTKLSDAFSGYRQSPLT